MIKVGWWSTLPLGYTEAMYQVLLRRDPIIHQTVGALDPLTNTLSWADCHALNQRLRRDGCTARQGLYAWGIGSPSHHTPVFGWTGNAHQMLLHRTDGSPIVAPDPPAAEQPPDGGLLAKMIDWGNETWRSYLVTYWLEWMRHPDPSYPDASYDDLIFDDNGAHFYAAQLLRLGGAGGTMEHGTAPLSWEWWWENLNTFKAELRWALESEGKRLLVNGISHQPYDPADPQWLAYGPHYSNLSASTSGVLAEHLCRAWLSPTDLFQTVGMMVNQFAQRRWIYCYLMPSLLPYLQPGYAGPLDGPAMEQFLWTFYKLLEDPGQTVPIYHDGAPYRGTTLDEAQPYAWDSGILHQLDLGHAIEGPIESPPGVLWRRFYGGYAMLNYTPEFRTPTIQRPCRVWDTVSGPVMGGGAGTFNMPGRSAWVLPYA